jgi:hypothetical protein
MTDRDRLSSVEYEKKMLCVHATKLVHTTQCFRAHRKNLRHSLEKYLKKRSKALTHEKQI